MVPAAEVEPLHAGQQIPKFLFHRVQRGCQRVGVLLTQGVEVQTIQQGGQLRRCLHGGIPLGAGSAKAAAGGAGVVDGVAFLRRALRVDAQANALACRLCRRAERRQLPGRVEHDMVRILQQFCKLILPVGGAEHMVLLVRQLLPAQAALVQAAGLGACQIRGQHWVHVKVGKGLLRQQNFAAGALLHASTVCTPLVVHLPVSSISAPHMAGTPVV